jgi:hypothetical protein
MVGGRKGGKGGKEEREERRKGRKGGIEMSDKNEATPPKAPPWQLAVDIAAGRIPAPPDNPSGMTWGAKNEYTPSGHGHTYVRRVWRGGRWEWLSPLASQGRDEPSDRYDVKYGYVSRGDVVAEYTMDGPREPHEWLLVDPRKVMGEYYHLFRKLSGTRRGDGQWDLRMWGYDEVILTVPDPYWR